MIGLKKSMALLMVSILVVPGLMTVTENVKADVFNTVAVSYKSDAFRERQGSYQKVAMKVWKQNYEPGIISAIITYNTAGTWLGAVQNNLHFDNSPLMSNWDTSSPSTGMDTHFYETYYGFLPIEGQNYDGYGHVGTAGGFIDVQTKAAEGNIGGPNSWSTYATINCRYWSISNGRWQSNWDGLTTISGSSSVPTTQIDAFVSYQTADWCVFWWNVHSTETHGFSMPYSDFD
jgi:hypothetical protein